MTEAEARALKVAQIVTWEGDATDCAEVKQVSDTALVVKWLDSGMIGVYKLAGPSIKYLQLLTVKGS